MTRNRLLACTALLLAFPGCTRDEIAPDCFNRDPQSGQCTTVNPSLGGALEIECGGPDSPLPIGAVGADYSYTVTANGSSLSFSAENLPTGLSIDSGTGEIFGAPEESGAFTDVRVTVENLNTGVVDSATCAEMTINPRLTFSTSGTSRGCYDGTGDLADLIVPDTGTGEAISCSLTVNPDDMGTCPLRDGNGRLPDGLGVSEDCQITGTNTEDVLGTTVWMVRVAQSGGETYVPFCSTIEPAGSDFHTVALDFPGTDNDPLDPAQVIYDPSLPLVFGEGTNEGPTFEVRAQDCTNNACEFYAFYAELFCSPFNLPLGTSPDMSIPDEGFEHDLTLSTQGETVEEQNTAVNDYTIRPWVANVSLWYCTSDDDTVCGEDLPTATIQANAQTRYNYAVIASPQ